MLFFSVFFKTLGFLSALVVFLILINILFLFSNDFQKNQFVMIDGDESSKNIIATINLNGPIFNANSNNLGNNFYDYVNPEQVKSYLNELEELNIDVLVINLNSPGGTVSATAELEKIILQFKNDTNAKVYFFTKEILASGGYWVATTGDKIFASYGSVIGSIGVSGPSWFYYNTPISISSGVFGQSIETKSGIEVYNHNAGKGKDVFNPYRKPKSEERKHLQSIVDEVYEDFITKVAKSRKIDLLFVKNNIGALIYSGNQAKNNFLIDGVLNYETLIKFIVKENKFDNYKIYKNKSSKNIFSNMFGNFQGLFNNNFYDDNICKNLKTSLNVVIPLFLSNC